MISENSLPGPSGSVSVLPITRDTNVQASPSNLGLQSKENGKGIPTVAPNTFKGYHEHLPTYASLDIDYEQKYAPDAPGEELGAQARVWSVYNDEARIADAEKVRRLNGTLDVLLVFAGLFSSVVTTFVAQSSQKLDSDYFKITASLLDELTRLQRAAAIGASVEDIPVSPLSSTSETQTRTDVWVNGLWLVSLTFSLLTALISVLAKQWIQHYGLLRNGAPRERAYVRQYRLWGFERWKIPIIVDFLPVLLNIALLLFFAGLAVYIAPLNTPIASVIIGLSATAFLAYAFTTVLPIFVSHCAYKTPVTDYIIVLAHLTHEYLILFLLRPAAFLCDSLWTLVVQNRPHRRLPRMPWAAYHYDPSSMTSREQSDIEEREDFIVVEALHWLCTSSANTSAASVSAQSASALPTNSSSLRSSRWIACRTAERELSALGRRCYMAQSPAVALANIDAIERLTRTVVHFPYELARISGVWSTSLWTHLYDARDRITSPTASALLRIALLERACSPDNRPSTLQSAQFAADSTFFAKEGLRLHPTVWRQLDRVLQRGIHDDEDPAWHARWREYCAPWTADPYENTSITLSEYERACGYDDGPRLLLDMDELQVLLGKRLESRMGQSHYLPTRPPVN